MPPGDNPIAVNKYININRSRLRLRRRYNKNRAPITELRSIADHCACTTVGYSVLVRSTGQSEPEILLKFLVVLRPAGQKQERVNEALCQTLPYKKERETSRGV